MTQVPATDRKLPLTNAAGVLICSSAVETGSRVIASEEVDRAFGMPIGKLRGRAGIESLAYAADGENELTLGAKAAGEALRAAACGVQQLEWIIATSETHHSFPSLSAQLHSRLLARENCAALDVGGACLGLLNALAVAQSLIGSRQARTILVVTADLHTRTLTPGRVAGEFGGLFGDGASAFLLRGVDSIVSVNLFLVAQGNMPPRSRLMMKRTVASQSNSTAKHSLVPPSRAWKK